MMAILSSDGPPVGLFTLILLLCLLATPAQSAVQRSRNQASVSTITSAHRLEKRSDTDTAWCDDVHSFFCVGHQTCFTGIDGYIGCCSSSSNCLARTCIAFTSSFSTSCDYSTGGCVYCSDSKSPHCATVTNVVASQFINFCRATPLYSTVAYVNALTSGSIAGALTTTTKTAMTASSTTVSSVSLIPTLLPSLTSASVTSSSIPATGSSSTTISSSSSDTAIATPENSAVSVATDSSPPSSSSAAAGQSTVTVVAASPPSSVSSSATISPGKIAGITVGAVAGIVLVLLLVVQLSRKKFLLGHGKTTAFLKSGKTESSGGHDGDNDEKKCQVEGVSSKEYNDGAKANMETDDTTATAELESNNFNDNGETRHSRERFAHSGGRGEGGGGGGGGGGGYQPQYRIINPDENNNHNGQSFSKSTTMSNRRNDYYNYNNSEDAISPVRGFAEAPTDRPIHAPDVSVAVSSTAAAAKSGYNKSRRSDSPPRTPTTFPTSSFYYPSPIIGRESVGGGGVATTLPTTPEKTDMLAANVTQRKRNKEQDYRVAFPTCYSPSIYAPNGQPPGSLTQRTTIARPAPSLPQDYSVAELESDDGEYSPAKAQEGAYSAGPLRQQKAPWRFLSAEDALSGGWNNEGKK